ncbi:uncharacterized protein LOC136081667 isoform X4 [Hydra vulgaris]|uniref:Uncharacterized protein LOC136079809 isoform X4 n=1 Tax=Hydra vulgaris TaxID=6087 RepID=A0ABM4C1F9_HYDVU
MKQNESCETLEISESLNIDESINYLFIDEICEALLNNVSSSSELIRILELNGFDRVDLDDFLSLLIDLGRINLVETIIEAFHGSATEPTNKSINLQMSSSLLTLPSGELSNAASNNDDIEGWHNEVTENQRNHLSDKLESSIKITLKTDFLNDNYVEKLKVYVNEAEVAAYINARSKVEYIQLLEGKVLEIQIKLKDHMQKKYEEQIDPIEICIEKMLETDELICINKPCDTNEVDNESVHKIEEDAYKVHIQNMMNEEEFEEIMLEPQETYKSMDIQKMHEIQRDFKESCIENNDKVISKICNHRQGNQDD